MAEDRSAGLASLPKRTRSIRPRAGSSAIARERSAQHFCDPYIRCASGPVTHVTERCHGSDIVTNRAPGGLVRASALLQERSMLLARATFRLWLGLISIGVGVVCCTRLEDGGDVFGGLNGGTAGSGGGDASRDAGRGS